MDEILIFGKSHTLRVSDAELDDDKRDPVTGMLLGYNHDTYSMFKMEPLFFGYIESINKTYDSNRGCVMTVNAKDHMKLLEVAQAVTNMGREIGHILPAINWDTDQYALAVFESSPVAGYQLADGKFQASVDPDEMKEGTYSSIGDKAGIYNYFFKNVMSALYIDEIVQLQAAAAGVPDKYLTQRIEPMHRIAPFWQSGLNNSLDFFNGQTESRYTICQKAAQLLMLEFFADEEGHIVVKIPNWVLSANFLQMNNCNIKYYDDLERTVLPQFFINEEGEIDVKSASEGEDSGGSGGGEGGSSSGGGGIGGFISRIFNSILDAIGSIFGFSSSSEEDKETIEAPVNNAEGTSNILHDPPLFMKWIKNALARLQESQRKSEEKEGLFTGLFSKWFPSLFSSEFRFNEMEQTEDNEDYTYANLTDNVILDILDDNNDRVTQLDEYRIKVKLGDIHDKNYGSLFALAKRYYGNMYKWHLIAEINNIFEPTEVEAGKEVILYFNEPISDYIINSAADDINTEIQELKFLRNQKLKSLGLSLKKQNNENEIIVSNFPFIKGEFISYPKSMRSKYPVLPKFKQKPYIRHKLNKRFLMPKDKIKESDLAAKLIYSNEAILNNLSQQLGTANNDFILSKFSHKTNNNGDIEITLTMLDSLAKDISTIKDAYTLSDYKYVYNKDKFEVILTITDIPKDPDLQYVLSDYVYKRNSDGTLEVILKIADNSITKLPTGKQPLVKPEKIKKIKNNVIGEFAGSSPKKEELPIDAIQKALKNKKIRLYTKDGKPLRSKSGKPIYYSNDLLFDDDNKLLSYKNGDLIYNADGKNIADLGGVEVFDNQGRRYVSPVTPTEGAGAGKGSDVEGTWKPPFIGKLEKVSKEKAARAKQMSQAVEGYRNSKAIVDETTQAKVEDKQETTVKKNNQRFRSQRTDQDIPAIPNEYVISFTLTDSDQEVYNAIEVGGSQAFGILEGSKGIPHSIFKCIPDKPHIMQFGLRVHPAVNCSPLVTNVEEAAILGAFLLYKSQLNRYSGVLTCIEDSMIKVGNPIRFYIYDEHPYPLARKFASNQDENATIPLGSYYFDPKYYKEQAVFYVESISRNIDVQNVSTMTLQLKNGRVMGITNPCDIMSIFYDGYYQEWQTRGYYYSKGGNNTALINAHTIKLAEEEKEEHQRLAMESHWKKVDEDEAKNKAKIEEETKPKDGEHTPESGIPKDKTKTGKETEDKDKDIYETDDKGNYTKYKGLKDNIIDPEKDTLEVQKEKKRAQEEWIKEHLTEEPNEPFKDPETYEPAPEPKKVEPVPNPSPEPESPVEEPTGPKVDEPFKDQPPVKEEKPKPNELPIKIKPMEFDAWIKNEISFDTWKKTYYPNSNKSDNILRNDYNKVMRAQYAKYLQSLQTK